jgi:tetraacyldisaccharide 4'-kinase
MIYAGVLAFRNYAYDKGWFRSQSHRIPTLVVGNLSTGGTGKTPMVEWLLERLSAEKPAVISRGYGRKTKGYLRVDPKKGMAESYGDEPLQIASKFTHNPVVVCENRNYGIRNLLREATPGMIILDDAFQHRALKAGFHILLSTYQDPFYADFPLPAGNLRETRAGARRAQAVVITKAPAHLEEEEKNRIRRACKAYTSAPVYFSYLEYQKLNLGEKQPVVLISGLAKPQPMEKYLQTHFNLVKHFRYPDHHHFSISEIRVALEYADKAGAQLICSDKDFVKIQALVETKTLPKINCLSVAHTFGKEDEAKLLNQIKDYLQQQSF